MNNALFALAYVTGLAVDLALLWVLLSPWTPVLRRGSHRYSVAASPFVISSDARGAHLLVETPRGANVVVHIYLGEDLSWRIQSSGTIVAALDGQAIQGEMRLFDDNSIQIGSETFVFKDRHSTPNRPVFEGYRIYGRPYRGGSSLVYPASRFIALRREARLKVRDPSRGEVEDKEALNTRVRGEYRHLKAAYGDASRLFPKPIELLTDKDGYQAIAMENVRGITLKNAIDRRTLRPVDVVRFGAAFARALEHLDTLGIVHCDLKPGNIVLRSGRCDDPCLVDFGIAVSVGEISLPGTPGYQSPEHRCQPMSPRSDVFVMGTLLKACLRDQDDGQELRDEIGVLIDDMKRDSVNQRPPAREVRERLEQMLCGGST